MLGIRLTRWQKFENKLTVVETSDKWFDANSKIAAIENKILEHY